MEIKRYVSVEQRKVHLLFFFEMEEWSIDLFQLVMPAYCCAFKYMNLNKDNNQGTIDGAVIVAQNHCVS